MSVDTALLQAQHNRWRCTPPPVAAAAAAGVAPYPLGGSGCRTAGVRKCLFSSPQPAAVHGVTTSSSRGGAHPHGHRARPLSAASAPTAAAAAVSYGSNSWLTGSHGAWGVAGGAGVGGHHQPQAASPYHSTYSTSPVDLNAAAAAAGSSTNWFIGGRGAAAAAGAGDAKGAYGCLDVRLGVGGEDSASSVTLTSQGSQYDAWQQELSFRVGSALRKLEQPVL